MGEMRTMGIKGDTKIIWNPESSEEVKNARRSFDDLRKKRFRAFKVKSDGKAGEEITTFDAHAEKLILVPAMAGG